MVYELDKHGVTQSQLINFLKCRQYSKLNLAGWTTMRTSQPMLFGEMAHSILEDIYTEVKDGRKDVPNEKEIHIRIDVLSRKVSKDSGQRADQDFYDKLEYNSALLDAVLPHYFKYWNKEDFGKIKWVELEKEFKFPLDLGANNIVTIRGKRDAMYEMSKNNYLFETKTKSQIDESTITELLAFDFQTDLYSIAVQHDYGTTPAGCRYNIIRRPGNRIGKTETLLSFTKRVSQEVASKPEYYFVRYKIEISKKKLSDFKQELISIVKEFQDWQEGRLPTYKNTHSCVNRYGTCQYLGICSNGDYTGFYQRKTVHPELSISMNGGSDKHGTTKPTVKVARR